MKTIKKLWPRLLTAVLAAAALTAAAGLGWLDRPDNTVADALYQRAAPTDGEIVVVGMDDRAVELLGPMPWDRSILADVVSYLNSDPENMPAAIGVDVLFVGASASPDSDEYLAAVCADGGNVVAAAAAIFGSGVQQTEDGGFFLNRRAVLDWEPPYPELAAGVTLGHINAMADTDGIMRHALLYVDAPDGTRVPSFARALYEKYCAYHGTAPNPAPATDRDGIYLLPYTAGPGGYSDGISVADLLECAIDPAEFAGKIVLIGPYTAGMQDEYYTAMNHAVRTYGVEIQANAIDAFRRGESLREAARLPQLAALFALAAALVLFLWDRKLPAAILGWLAVTAFWLGLCLVARRLGLALHPLWVPLAAAVLFVASVAANYVRAQRERRRVADTFGRYVDPAVLRELLETGGEALELGGRMCEIAVLFVDIRGFTTMSESLDPPTVVEIINRYLTLTTDCISRWHGTLDKFVGDCTMAIWNAPLPQEDPVYLACRAAMDMVAGSKALGEELARTYGRSVNFGVGVNFGPAVVGNIGAPRRMDYTAIGDTVNTAARLEANAPGGTIYISRVVADALGDRAKTTSLGGSIKLKGKADGFEILTLDALE